MDLPFHDEPAHVKYYGIDMANFHAAGDEPGVKYHGVDAMGNSDGCSDTNKEAYTPAEVYDQDTGKQVSSSGDYHGEQPGYYYGEQQPPSSFTLSDKEVAVEAQPTAKRNWWKRKRFWTAAILTLIAIGAIVGCVVGLKKTSSSGNDEAKSAPEPGTISACRGTTCNQVLSASSVGNELQILARGQDQGLWTRVFNGTSWTEDWTSLGGSFTSQPTSVVRNSGNQINVFGLDSSGASVVTKSYQDGQWSPAWLALKEAGSSPVGACYLQRPNIDRADIFVRDADGSTNILHDWWNADKGEWWGQSSSWDNTAYAPAYVTHNQYDENAGAWRGWSDRGGSFVGDPVVVSPSDSQVDFFGTGSDGAIYHFSWDSTSNYTSLESLEGTFENMPTVVVTSSERLDVVAVGTDDKLNIAR
ncbi:Uu.00g121230.m01.CDS01 [Anthostomella pinea]|uniref:Uu.00g121230.m01.CDS01 n=1 Tax=Anthostomella pinea TaxID=933095 RepID=A0AAI8VGW4_9PEZI|nr:Uu.00g121230.m01.CDS01 [Anthostomella pinea]